MWRLVYLSNKILHCKYFGQHQLSLDSLYLLAHLIPKGELEAGGNGKRFPAI